MTVKHRLSAIYHFCLINMPFISLPRFLHQLRKNRDDEAELMKDVPGWIPGTCYGEPVYKTLQKDELIDPLIQEYYAHSRDKDLLANVHAHFWS